jgi:hypothetical protein
MSFFIAKLFPDRLLESTLAVNSCLEQYGASLLSELLRSAVG